jgi:hypothetical protein
MPCPIPDRNERPVQDLNEFKEATDANPEERQRLQELAEQIPKTYGIGDLLDKALLAEQRAKAALEAATTERESTYSLYAFSLSLHHEERRLLESLGLTANLFRKDAQ